MLSSLRTLGAARAITWLVVGFVVTGGVAASLLLWAIPVGPVPINIRWTADVSDARRTDLEREFHLTEGHPTEGATGTTWAYLLTVPSTEGIRAIVQHPAVDDTAHINRVRFRPEFANDRARRVIFFAGILAGLGALAALCWVAWGAPTTHAFINRTGPSARLKIAELIRSAKTLSTNQWRHMTSSGPTEPDIRAGLQWRAFAVALVAVSALSSAVWLIHPPVYLTPDDVGIRLALEGGTGFAQPAHSVLGWALAWLYGMLPNVPWWDLILAGTLFWALAVLCALAWPALGSSWPARTTALAAIGAASLPLLGAMQFTFSATAAGAAAMLLAGTESSPAARTRRSVLVMAALLFLMGSFVRPTGAFAGALAVGLMLMPLAAVTRPALGAGVGRLAGVLLIAALAFTALLSLDGAVWGRSPDSNQRYQRDWMTRRMFEWGGEFTGEQVDAIRASVGWSANDWQMLGGGSWSVPELHEFQRVAAAYETGTALVGWNERLGWLTTRLAGVDGASVWRLGEASAWLLLVGGTLAGAYGTRRSWATIVLVVAMFFGFCVAIEVGIKELPLRLLAPLACGFLAVMVVSVGAHRRVPSPLVAFLGLSVVLAVLAHEGRAIASSMAAERRHSLQVDGEVERLMELEPSLVLSHSDSFPAEHWWRPFHQPAIPLPMTTGAGRYLRALCEDPSILVLSEPGRLEMVTTYFQEHENRQVEWEEVYAASFRAYRCVDAALSR